MKVYMGTESRFSYQGRPRTPETCDVCGTKAAHAAIDNTSAKWVHFCDTHWREVENSPLRVRGNTVFVFKSARNVRNTYGRAIKRLAALGAYMDPALTKPLASPPAWLHAFWAPEWAVKRIIEELHGWGIEAVQE